MRKLILTAALAAAALLASEGKAAAQYPYYGYGYSPYRLYASQFQVPLYRQYQWNWYNPGYVNSYYTPFGLQNTYVTPRFTSFYSGPFGTQFYTTPRFGYTQTVNPFYSGYQYFY
jgi:hypothetical protein